MTDDKEHVTLSHTFREHKDEQIEIRVTVTGEGERQAADKATERLDQLKERLENND